MKKTTPLLLAFSVLLSCVNNMPVNRNETTVIIGLEPEQFLNSNAQNTVNNDRLLVRYNNARKLRDSIGNLFESFNEAINTAVINLTQTDNVEELINKLLNSEFVENLEYDLEGETKLPVSEIVDFIKKKGFEKKFKVAHIPQDPLFSQAVSTNDGSLNLNYGLQLVQATSAWDITQGSPDIKVAILDSGIDLNHPEFQGRLLPGYNFVSNNDDPTDDNGHGTHIAGIIAANIDNGQGLAGLAPKVKIMPVKVLNERMGGKFHNVSRGITWAVDNGANVINLSLQAPRGNNELQAAIQYALDNNVTVISAMGNDGNQNASYPAAYADMGVISVGSITSDLKRSSFSNFGPWMTLTAPGSSILSTVPIGTGRLSSELNSSDYDFKDGTSQSTPYIAATAALLLSLNPGLKPFQVKYILEKSTIDLGDREGHEPAFGHGLIDAHKALKLLQDGVDIDDKLAQKPVIKQISAEPFFIRPGMTVSLEAKVNKPTNQPLGFGWAVSGGEISGNGEKVTWNVPNQPGNYQIVVGVSADIHKVYATTNAFVVSQN